MRQSRDDRFGLPRQEEAIRLVSVRLGATIVETFTDSITGTTATRHDLDRLLSASRTGVDLIIISETRALGRRMSVSYAVLEELMATGLPVHAGDMHGVIDMDDDASVIQLSTKVMYDHLERNKVVARTVAAKLAKAKSGSAPNGLKAYGYRYNLPDPAESVTVRRIFEWSAEGKTLMSIQDALNAEGIPIPQPTQVKDGAAMWHRTVVAKILRNRTYKGEHHWKTYVIPVPAIVSADLWARAQKGKRGVKPSSGWPLVGHVRCGVCGARLNANRIERTRRTTTYHREMYRCSSRSTPQGACGAMAIEREWLEQEAETLVRATLSDPDLLRQLLDDHRPPETGNAERLAQIAAEDTRWLEAFRAGGISAPELTQYRRELEAERRALLEPPEPTEYPLEKYAQAARDLPFAELMGAGGIVVIAVRDGTLRLAVE